MKEYIVNILIHIVPFSQEPMSTLSGKHWTHFFMPFQSSAAQLLFHCHSPKETVKTFFPDFSPPCPLF